MESFSRKPTLSASLLPSYLFDASHDSGKKYRHYSILHNGERAYNFRRHMHRPVDKRQLMPID
jgi:hypothetical protein